MLVKKILRSIDYVRLGKVNSNQLWRWDIVIVLQYHYIQSIIEDIIKNRFTYWNNKSELPRNGIKKVYSHVIHKSRFLWYCNLNTISHVSNQKGVYLVNMSKIVVGNEICGYGFGNSLLSTILPLPARFATATNICL